MFILSCEAPASEVILVPSDADLFAEGLPSFAEKCFVEHCFHEVWACCTNCLVALCTSCWDKSRCHEHCPGMVQCDCQECAADMICEVVAASTTPLPPPPLVDVGTPILEKAAAPMTPLPPPVLVDVGTPVRHRLHSKAPEALTCYSALACSDTLRRLNSETSIATTPQSADSRSKMGGWRKCGHPCCPCPSETLQALSGLKQGFSHRTHTDVRVCGPCRNRPWPANSTVLTTSVAVPVARQKSDIERFAIEMETWKDDTPDKLIQLFVHTAENCQAFAWERWQLGCRVARLLDLPDGERP